MPLQPTTIAATFIVVVITYQLSRIVYSLIWHPLANVPGPKLAAISSLWILYVDLEGHPDVRIAELHEKYGAVIRISPNEVSIRDIDIYYKTVYAQNTKYHKAEYYYSAFNSPGATVFSETNKDIHAKEKRLMNHAFSRANLVGFQPAMYGKIRKFIRVLQGHVKAGRHIPLWNATQCLTLDTVSEFSFGEAMGALDAEDFHHPFIAGLESFSPYVTILQHFPWLKPAIASMQTVRDTGFGVIHRITEQALKRLKDHKQAEETDGMCMFDSMVHRAAKSGVHLSDERLKQNGSLMLCAGTGTTALSLTTAIYHLSANPSLWYRLQETLLARFPQAMTGDPDIADLEKIPLLAACVKEAERVSVPIRGRFPRIVPEGGLKCYNHFIPAGCLVSSFASLYCHDHDIFPDPGLFNPDRWLKNEDSSVMQHHLLVFSHGSRACIGQSFANIEMYIALAQIVMNFNPGKVLDESLGFIAHSISSPDSQARVLLHMRESYKGSTAER